MKIEELLKVLCNYRDKYGNIDVCIDDEVRKLLTNHPFFEYQSSDNKLHLSI